MTLIAGFHSFDTPVLIGDFLTTSTLGTSGLRKKILRIADNFALAWTGHLVAADLVIRFIERSLDLNSVTFASVEAVLTDGAALSEFSGLQVRLVCWVIDSEGQHCFRWNSLYPHRLFSGAPTYDGSGELWALALAGVNGLRYSSPPDTVVPDQAIRGALGITTNLLDSEMWGPSTRALGFGFGYEILQWVNGTRFEYIDNALYIPLTFELDDQGHFLKREFGSSFYKYEAHDNCSVLYIYDPIAHKQDRHVITPPGRHSEQIADELCQRIVKPTPYPFESDYYCISIRLKGLAFVTPPSLFFIIARDESQRPGAPCRIDPSKADEIWISYDRKWVEWMYDTIRADMNKTGQL